MVAHAQYLTTGSVKDESLAGMVPAEIVSRLHHHFVFGPRSDTRDVVAVTVEYTLFGIHWYHNVRPLGSFVIGITPLEENPIRDLVSYLPDYKTTFIYRIWSYQNTMHNVQCTHL